VEGLGSDWRLSNGNLAGTLSFTLGGTGNPPTVPIIGAGSDYSIELRVRFPDQDNQDLFPTVLSGTIWTLSSGSFYASAWYEKPALGSLTGNLYLTSSFGRVQLTSASLFDDRFYNISCVSDVAAGGITLRAMRHESDEEVFSMSSFLACDPTPLDFNRAEVGSSVLFQSSSGEFWAQEFRIWTAALNATELRAHSLHFESYGRDESFANDSLSVHLRLNDGATTDVTGTVSIMNSVPGSYPGTGTGFVAESVPFTKFLEGYAYIPSIDFGWNQEKVRVFDGSRIDPFDAYHDEKFVSLEFNLYDALNEDISHLMVSYDELTNVLGLPVNRYREEYEGLVQMRETYFKRLQGPLNFRVFVDMLDFFDTSFSSIIERILPARTSFKGDEMIVESHMLERPKYQYQLRPIVEGRIEISGSISVVDRGDDFD